MTLTGVLRKIAGLLLLAGVALTSLGQTAQREQPPLIIKSTFGADLYQFYCSSCHGMDGKGRPARSALHTAPPDLTILSRQNGGAFPRSRSHDDHAWEESHAGPWLEGHAGLGHDFQSARSVRRPGRDPHREPRAVHRV